MRRLLFVLAVAACGDDDGYDYPCARAHCIPGDGPQMLHDPHVDGAAVYRAANGFQAVDGPQWQSNHLSFSDPPANTIYQYICCIYPTQVSRMPSGNAAGLATSADSPTGPLIAAEQTTHAITRDGTPLVDTFEGKALNSPNDVVVADDGTIYFTDPPDGLGSRTRELDFNGVFRLSPNGDLTAEHRGALTERPNGIALNPVGDRLYVTDSADGNIWTFSIDSNGSLGKRELLASTAGEANGLAIDWYGNLFVATKAGIEVFAPTGLRWGTIAVPEQPSNCAFGEFDHMTLFITAQTGLYSLRLSEPGRPLR